MFPSEYKRTARFAALLDHDSFAGPDDFIEVTEWYNGEGFDVQLSAKSREQQFSLTWGELSALRATLGNWWSDDDDAA
jgi:hypothetical protein